MYFNNFFYFNFIKNFVSIFLPEFWGDTYFLAKFFMFEYS